MLESLAANHARAVGFSDGGEYELLMATMKPDAIRALATWGAAGSLGTHAEMADMMTTVVDSPIPPMEGFSQYLKTTYGEDNARIMTQSAGKSFRSIIEAGGDISLSRAGSISCHALLITGENDFLAAPPMVSELARAIPNGEFIEAKGAGHPVHLEQTEWLVDTITGWLAQH